LRRGRWRERRRVYHLRIPRRISGFSFRSPQVPFLALDMVLLHPTRSLGFLTPSFVPLDSRFRTFPRRMSSPSSGALSQSPFISLSWFQPFLSRIASQLLTPRHTSRSHTPPSFSFIYKQNTRCTASTLLYLEKTHAFCTYPHLHMHPFVPGVLVQYPFCTSHNPPFAYILCSWRILVHTCIRTCSFAHLGQLFSYTYLFPPRRVETSPHTCIHTPTHSSIASSFRHTHITPQYNTTPDVRGRGDTIYILPSPFALQRCEVTRTYCT
jgi:hypothetical protein